MSSPPRADALFLRDGDVFVPTVHTRGPWDPAAEHGGPPAALMASLMEREPSNGPMQVTRLTVEFMRPVPLAPLRVRTRVRRPGRRVQLLEAALESDGVELCRAVALRIRTTGATPPVAAMADDAPPPGPLTEQARADAPPMLDEGFPTTGVDMHFVRGEFMAQGPSTVWFRLRHPLVAGEVTSPLARAVAAADFGNGVSAILDWGSALFINPDLTVYLVRPPEGEWVCLDAVTRIGDGLGVAESGLFDERGRIGRSLQSLYVDAR